MKIVLAEHWYGLKETIDVIFILRSKVEEVGKKEHETGGGEW